MNDPNRHGRSSAGAISAILAIMTVGLVAAAALAKHRSKEDRRSSGSGKEGASFDGAAPAQGPTSDFKMPEDMRAVIPEPPSYAPA